MMKLLITATLALGNLIAPADTSIKTGDVEAGGMLKKN